MGVPPVTLPMFSTPQTEPTSDDYLTPRWVFDLLAIDFDVDVAASPWQTNVPAKRCYTKADDGLAQRWDGRVWMNPPFSQTTRWVDRFIEHHNGIALVPCSKAWWLIRLWEVADGIAFPPAKFEFDGHPYGGHQPFMVMFAAFTQVCVEALNRMGRVRF